MTRNNLMLRLRYFWSFGECGVPLHCHRTLIKSNILRKILSYTIEFSFYNHLVNIYIRPNGITMGSALRPTFNNLYMAYLEKKFQLYKKKYLRYVSDSLHLVHGTNELHNLQLAFQNIFLLKVTYELNMNRWCPRGVMVKAMNWEIEVIEFELQSRYYIHFRTNTLWKGMNPLILLCVLLEGWL